MTVRFYFDENVPDQIADGARLRGCDVVTAEEDGYRQTDDSVLLDRAGFLGRVMFSRDADLIAEAVRRRRAGESFAGVVYGHQMYVSIGRCVTDLEIIAGAMTAAELEDRIMYLPL